MKIDEKQLKNFTIEILNKFYELTDGYSERLVMKAIGCITSTYLIESSNSDQEEMLKKFDNLKLLIKSNLELYLEQERLNHG